jgi:carboxypeptidase family protein
MLASKSPLPVMSGGVRLQTIVIVWFLIALSTCEIAAMAQSGGGEITGTVLDPGGRPAAGAQVCLASASGAHLDSTTGSNGEFTIALPKWGAYSVRLDSVGFAPVKRELDLSAATPNLILRLEQVIGDPQVVVVSADMSKTDLYSPDPSQRVMVREEVLDANPGRPGAPLSVPGLPIETAAGGIKAPQYFAPGVAGDHGESIAQYIAVGGFLVPNNLSANAHGNGYADPNIYISAAVASVETDGGTFSVLEGNHARNLAATYRLRPRLSRFLTLTGDYRDADLTAGLAPSDPLKKEWLALEANYGNGLMRTLEHRKQFKWNAMRVFDHGKHEITLLSIGYWGHSYEGNLVPIGYAVQVNDTLDPRQQDQTHTGLLAANDQWKTGAKDEADFSGYFRTYNLALFSNFGQGLIRQSEFRTVEGGEVHENHKFKSRLEGMAGLLYNADDIHNDDLDHYLSPNPPAFGAFVPVLGNNVTIREVAPYVALHFDLSRHVHFYGGLRHEQVEMKSVDKYRPQYSFDKWGGFENPKATLTLTPGAGPVHWLPSASFSIGQAFFTDDPRIELATSATSTGIRALADPIERSHAEQMVLEKEFSGTDVRVTAGRTTMTATLAKIDPDKGSADDLGPSTLKFFTAMARHQFTFGTLQAVFSKADARLATFDGVPGTVVPEAPRTIFDALTTLDRLPWGLHGRGEYEYVGHKFLDVGNPNHSGQYEAIPVGETRLAVIRPFLNGRLTLGGNGEIARGYTGQTTEITAPGWKLGQVPYCAPGSGATGHYNDFDCGTNERAVGVRMVSWVGGSIAWRLGEGR